MKKCEHTTITADHQKELVKLIKQAAYNHAEYQVFNDFLEMAAITVSNSVDFTHREEREKRYLEIINSYAKPQQPLFPEMLAHLILGLEEKTQTTGPEDILGPIFHELELHSRYKGQFFTPQHISDLMAKLTVGDDPDSDKIDRDLESRGYITALEPACGSGVMMTSLCKAMRERGLNYCSQLVITAVDIDLKCVHMAYLQMALYGVPAVIIHGDSLAVKEWSRWYTPIYLANGWIWRERCGITTAFCREDEMIKQTLEPSYAAMRQVEAMIAASTPAEAATESRQPGENSTIEPPTVTLMVDESTGQLGLF